MIKNHSWLYKYLLLFIIGLSFQFATKSQDVDQYPSLPCDFYGVEEYPGLLDPGQIITARDSDSVIIGQCNVTDSGQYGFLTSSGDILGTPEDEGAVDGDIITFYVDGNKQRQQAVWKSGEAIKVDLGVPVESGAFTLHLFDMPGYSNYNNDPRYSGVAVSDMILDYLDETNTDTQLDLMSYADTNRDQESQGSETERLLNYKAPSVYNFGSTSTIARYSDWGIINEFDATVQNDCIKQICHWLAYQVPNAPEDKQYVPVAIATSSNPAVSADSDYQHWMSLVGIKTDRDPFPSLSDYHSFREVYDVPDSIQLYGVYLNDPGQSGLGFHTYIAADLWSQQYFRPIASGLQGEGSYVAILEPPDPEAVRVTIQEAKRNSGFEVLLQVSQTEVSFFIPGWVDPQVREYLLGLFEQLKDSSDFITLIDDPYFSQALKEAQINRIFKVDGGDNDNYTIIPFEKNTDQGLVTTSAVIVNNQTGQFQIASADLEASGVFEPLSWYRAYSALRGEIGWQEYPVNRFLSYAKGSAFYPGWSVTTLGYSRQGSVTLVNSYQYDITAEEDVNKVDESPQVEVLGRWSFGRGRNWTKIVLCDIKDSESYTVSVDRKNRRTRVYLYNNNDQWLVILRGRKNARCRVKISRNSSTGNIRQGGVTYMQVRR